MQTNRGEMWNKRMAERVYGVGKISFDIVE